MSLTLVERQVASAIGFDEDICAFVKKQTGLPLQRLSTITEDGNSEHAMGLSVPVDRAAVAPIVDTLQPYLLPRGFRAYWSEIHEPNGAKRSDEIVVVKGTDDNEIIRLRRTDGANYGISMGDIIRILKDWRNRCRFEIHGAARSWVAIVFETLPENLCSFAEEIYEFCPDTVDQGVGLKNERDAPEEFEAARLLCPKLSGKMQQRLDEEKARVEVMLETQPQLRAALERGGFTTPTDMGIRLLAHELKRSHELFLWWD